MENTTGKVFNLPKALVVLSVVTATSMLEVSRSEAIEGLTPRSEPVQVDSRFVPVPLTGLLNDRKELGVAATQVLINDIPIDLASQQGDNLFLHNAGWSDWEQDPLDFYSLYDQKPKEKTATMPVVQIPVADYSAVYLLAATEDDAEYSDVVTFRIGAKDYSSRTTYHDFEATVPRFSAAGGAGVIKTFKTPIGNVFLVRVPLGKALAQDFQDRYALDVEITKQVRLAIASPDAARFQLRPLGLPSGVHIFGVTFERAPLHMTVSSSEVGHIFNEPQVPTFRANLKAPGGWAGMKCTVQATATDFYGNVTTTGPQEVAFGWSVTERNVVLPLPVSKRGFHKLEVTATAVGREPLRRETTFALLAPNTRKHRSQSPFGTWDFGGTHYTPPEANTVGPLYVKAGLKYGMFTQTEAERQQYGITKGNDPNAADEKLAVLTAALEKRGKTDDPEPPRWLIFHENSISGPHITRTPDLFTGQKYQFSTEEQKTFDKLWDTATRAGKMIRKDFPNSEIYFGNGPPHLLEEFLRHKFPKELFDVRGNEAGNFMRPPETQPTDFVANNAGLWMDRQLLDHYGYADKGLKQCFEITYPSTNPGNLSLSTQASYYLRSIMHSLAWRVPLIRPGLLVDTGNSYWYSNWGASGLFFAQPNMSPKPSYVAMAVLTQVLDGATFERVVPLNSSTAYAFGFRRKDGGYVTCLWTTRGKRDIEIDGGRSRNGLVTDMMGNESRFNFQNRRVTLNISEEPIFLTTSQPLRTARATTAQLAARPEGEKFLVASMAELDEWTVENQPDQELEIYNFTSPRRKGNFIYEKVAQVDGESNVLSVQPRMPVPGPVYLPMYSELLHNTGAEIPGKPTEVGIMVRGNGGWGRIIWEFEDAAGQRWISIGAEQKGEPNPWMADWMTKDEFARLKGANVSDWNSNDPWGRSVINFEGWHYLKFPMPGNYPGEGYHWPYNNQWRCVKADGSRGNDVVAYPLKFKKLAITLPEKVLYATEYRAVANPRIYLKDLMVSYAPPEVAFQAP